MLNFCFSGKLLYVCHEHYNIIFLGKIIESILARYGNAHYGGGMETVRSHTRPAYVVMFTPTVGVLFYY